MSEIDKLHQVIKTLSETVSSISKENIELNLYEGVYERLYFSDFCSMLRDGHAKIIRSL